MSGRCIIESQQWKIESFVQNLRSIWLEVNICITLYKKEEGDDRDYDGDDGDGDDDDWRSIHRFRDRTNQVTSAYLHQLHTCIDKKVRTCISQAWETLLPCPLGL